VKAIVENRARITSARQMNSCDVNPGKVTSTTAETSPARFPARRRAMSATTQTRARPASAPGRRIANSLNPSTLPDAAMSQYESGG
jgi:hypothetical protein